MPKEVDIDGVRFESSAAIAARFGSAPEKVDALAQAGKIEASLVGKIWFIDPASYTAYHQDGTKEHDSELSAEDISSLLPKAGTFSNRSAPHGLLAAAQTLAVVACGLFVGGIGWYAQIGELSTEQLQAGVFEMYTQFDAVFSFGNRAEQSASLPQAPLPSSEVLASEGDKGKVFTVLPEATYERVPKEYTEFTEAFTGTPVLVQ